MPLPSISPLRCCQTRKYCRYLTRIETFPFRFGFSLLKQWAIWTWERGYLGFWTIWEGVSAHLRSLQQKPHLISSRCKTFFICITPQRRRASFSTCLRPGPKWCCCFSSQGLMAKSVRYEVPNNPPRSHIKEVVCRTWALEFSSSFLCLLSPLHTWLEVITFCRQDKVGEI